MIDLSNQTVLVIGGLHEVALGVARAFQQVGAAIILASDPAADEDQPEPVLPGATQYDIDLSDPAAVARQVAALPPVQTVVISPAWFQHIPFMAMTAADIDRAVAQNFEQATYLAQAAAKHLLRHKIPGSLIFLSSVASLTPTIQTNMAGSTLAALEVVAKMAAVDLGPHRIRVNIVAAGWVDSAWSQPLLTEAGRLYNERDVPLRRVGQPEEVGEVCCFLASPLARYVTGAILPVDGGYLLTKSEGVTPSPPGGAL